MQRIDRSCIITHNETYFITHDKRRIFKVDRVNIASDISQMALIILNKNHVNSITKDNS